MIYAKKSLGQNFLVDLNIIKKITNLIKISNKNILEIGPGKGALTDEILKKNPRSLTLIEKDISICKELQAKYIKNKNIQIYNKDFLKFDIEKLLKDKTIIFGNLPYNVSSQILVKMIKFKYWPPKYTDLVFMFQKEMSQRILGSYNTKNYGRLSIFANYRLNIINKFDVSPNCFSPKPKVNSTVLLFKPKKSLIDIKDMNNLEKVTNILFSNKRKMINKNIKKVFKKKNFIIKDLNLKSRPSEIKPEKYYEMTKLYEEIR
jgi:16S rRNA (adenine1518-N6/adenine1519-N6)-dimethyltransferase